METARETLSTALILAAPASLAGGCIHTACFNSPGIILGFAACMILAVLANLIAE